MGTMVRPTIPHTMLAMATPEMGCGPAGSGLAAGPVAAATNFRGGEGMLGGVAGCGIPGVAGARPGKAERGVHAAWPSVQP